MYWTKFALYCLPQDHIQHPDSTEQLKLKGGVEKGHLDFWLKLNIAKTAPNFPCWFV